MSLAAAELLAELRSFAQACQDALKTAELSVQFKTLEIEKLKFQIPKLRRIQFGRSLERINRQIEQLELRLKELETSAAEDAARVEQSTPTPASEERSKPKRRPLPDHLRRQEIVRQPANDGACTCPDYGRGIARLGEGVTEVLDYVPGHFQVVRHVRPKYACTACDAITQAPAPPMPTPLGRATPANQHDTKGIVPVLRELADGGFQGVVLRDFGYRSKLLTKTGETFGITVEAIARRRAGQFVPAGICWVVERILAWRSRYRRLNTIFERSKKHVIAFVEIAFISILCRRLNRLAAEQLIV
jgi:hypothetical protein